MSFRKFIQTKRVWISNKDQSLKKVNSLSIIPNSLMNTIGLMIFV